MSGEIEKVTMSERVGGGHHCRRQIIMQHMIDESQSMHVVPNKTINQSKLKKMWGLGKRERKRKRTGLELESVLEKQL